MLLLALGCDPPAPPAGPPSIVLVSLDTLRADRIGAYGSDAGATPNLDRFAEEAVLFEDAYSQSCETLFSHASLMTSRYPSELGPLDYSLVLPEDRPTIAEVLKVYGYQTAAFTGGGHLSADFGFARGFDAFESPEPFGGLYHTRPPARAWLDARDPEAPFLLFVHGYDSHHRYLKPPPFGTAWVDHRYRGVGLRAARTITGTLRVKDGYYFPERSPGSMMPLSALRVRSPEQRRADVQAARAAGERMVKLSERDLTYLRGLYTGAAAYTDAMFGLLMADLAARDLLDTAVIVVFSDHGEELGEDGLFDHRFGLSDAVLHVPLMIRLPGAAGGSEAGGSEAGSASRGRRVSGLVGLIDVAPTLLELADAVLPSGIHGRSLNSALDGGPLDARPAVFSEGAYRGVSARTPEGRLSFSGISADSPFLPDLLVTAALGGPAFTSDDGLPERATARDALVAWRRELSPSPIGAGRLSEAQRAALQKHGYWDHR